MPGLGLLRKRKPKVSSFHQSVRIKAREMNLVLERERTRADRSGQPLCLILIGIDGRVRRRSAAEKVVDVLRRRARITDEVGIFNKHSGYAVLPETKTIGARIFAESVREQLKSQGVKSSYAVYQYTPTAQDREDPPNQSGGGRGSDQGRLNGGGRASDRELQPAAVALVRDDEPFAHALEPVLINRVPWWKRTMDVSVASLGLIAVSPLFAAIAIAIKMDSPGEVFFRQSRSGLGGKPFSIYKFRTMGVDAEAQREALLAVNEQDGPAFKIKADPRVTRIGAFLRKTSLDELPQLINVLKGEMTLVGPRPLPCHETDASLSWHRRRLEITPGLTCIWQVRGRSVVSFDDWVRMDMEYLRRRTFFHDVKILFATVPAVLKQRGAC